MLAHRRPPRSGAAVAASASRRAYVLSGRRPKPDVGNLAYTQAHAPLPLPAGHARMPPGPSETVTELYMQGFPRPTFGLSPKAGRPLIEPAQGSSEKNMSAHEPPSRHEGPHRGTDHGLCKRR